MIIISLEKRLDFTNIFENFFASNLEDQTLANNTTVLGYLLLCMLGWTLFYLVLSWYFERVFPGEYGIKLPYYFPFMVVILADNN